MTRDEIEAAIARAPKTTAQMLANRKAWLEKNGMCKPRNPYAKALAHPLFRPRTKPPATRYTRKGRAARNRED